MSRILLAVTTYNQIEYTKKFYESFKKIKDKNVDLIIIDDCSTDGTEEWALENNISFFTNGTPSGLTHSWNTAYKIFKESKYDFLIISNNDILLPDQAITELVTSSIKFNASVIVPMSTPEGIGHNPAQDIFKYYADLREEDIVPENFQQIQDYILEVKSRLNEEKFLYLVDPLRMKHFNGFFFMINRDIINLENKEGWLFDPANLMIKNEDTFNWRVLLPNNHYPWICRTSYVFHWKGVSTGSVFEDFSKKANNKEWIKNRI